jgi:hypothetical protein
MGVSEGLTICARLRGFYLNSDIGGAQKTQMKSMIPMHGLQIDLFAVRMSYASFEDDFRAGRVVDGATP